MAKDLFRASGLPHAPADDHEVNKDQKKVKSEERVSPDLLVREPRRLQTATTVFALVVRR